MMKENLIQVICGPGKGKTASALGRGVTALLKGKTVIMVQFLKGSMETEGMEIVKRLEPEFKLFRFELRFQSFYDLHPSVSMEPFKNCTMTVFL